MMISGAIPVVVSMPVGGKTGQLPVASTSSRQVPQPIAHNHLYH